MKESRKLKINNNLGRILDIIKTSMKPEYQFVFDVNGNVIFLDYTKHGAKYTNYSYRWVWHKQKTETGHAWYLIPFPQFHWRSLELLPYEMELAARAYEDIKKHENESKNN